MMKRRAALGWLVALMSNVADGQSVVRVEADGQIGQGVALVRGADCRIIVPRHVVGDMLGEVFVASSAGGRAVLDLIDNATVILPMPDGTEAREDLVLLKPRGDGEGVCDNNLSRFPGQDARVVTTDGQKNFRFHDVTVRDQSDRSLIFTFNAAQPGQIQSMSGAPLLRNGALAGMVVRLATSTGDGQQVAYTVDLLARQFGDWVRGEAVPVARAEEALSVLERVRKQLPSSDVGQVSALSSLAKGGARLAGLDLQGFFFERAVLGGVDMSGSNFSGAALTRARFTDAIFTGATFDFAVGQDVEMVGAKLDRSHHQYADYDRGNFAGATFRQANLYFATLRAANLANADFSGANLSYADLTGANITGARFENAILYGAILNGVQGLDSAHFRATGVTNMVGASARLFTDDEVCGHYVYGGGSDHMGVVERIPSSRFDDGFQSTRLDREAVWNTMPASVFGMNHTHFLRACAELPESERPVGVRLSYEAGSTLLTVGAGRAYHTDLLSKRGLRDYIRTRMTRRNTEVLTALSARTVIIPTSIRNRPATLHLQRLTSAIREATIDCIDPETNDHLLRAYRIRPPALTFDEVVAQIIDAVSKRAWAEDYAQRTRRTRDETMLLPFGDIYPGARSGALRHLASDVLLDRDFIAAYEAWSQKRSANATYAFCAERDGLPDGITIVDSSFRMMPVDSIIASVLRDRRITSAAQTRVRLRESYLTVVWVFDSTPPGFLRSRAELRAFAETIDETEQHQTVVEIQGLEALPGTSALIVHVRRLREQSVKVGRPG